MREQQSYMFTYLLDNMFTCLLDNMFTCLLDNMFTCKTGEKHRHCGAIMTGNKNVTSNNDVIQVQFHSDEHDNHTETFQYFTRTLKGFFLYFTGKYLLVYQLYWQVSVGVPA